MKFKLDDFLQNVQNVGIGGHIRPDGDCVGACLGLYQYIRTFYPDIYVKLYLEEIPDSFHFLHCSDEICHDSGESTVFDVFFSLDCADDQRLGEYGRYFRNAKKTVCIDHHITNAGFAEYNFVKADASSTCELICDLIGMDRITDEMAQALYMGIAHDTGVFQYSCTSSHTMEVAGALMDKGIDHTSIVQETFFCRTYLQQQLLGRALLESVPARDGRIMYSSISLKMLKFFHASSKDLEGIVSLMKNTYGVDVSMFFYEITPMEWKVSLRSSEKVDVSAVASAFGGGGHRQAAGCTVRGNRNDVLRDLLPLIERQMEERL